VRYHEVPGVPADVSRLVLGTLGLATSADADRILDDFFERGGNAVDTAYVYADGECERLLGRWMADRGMRAETVVITKGAHPPACRPEMIGPQLTESLERLQTDVVDLYFLHRDNADVPVAEFVAALNEEKQAGRIRAFGGSNWTLARLQAANQSARDQGLDGMVAVSNNFSLAEMGTPPWPGCIASLGPAWREWLRDAGVSLFPWSSQAQGFFAPGRVEKAHLDAAFTASWLSDANLDRLDRAKELARARGSTAVAVALAYVLAQPFLTFPLIGPLDRSQLESSLTALDIDLSAQDIEWLATGDGPRQPPDRPDN
jgi:aryl-alcohol dehydrogenase-like predicted oxidoreductase